MSTHATKRKHRSFRRKQAKNWCFIYVLRESEGSPIRYVGQTRMALSERLSFHFKSALKWRAKRHRQTPVQQWVKTIGAERKAPIIEMLDKNGVWDTSEAVWIDRLLARGEPLLNVQSVVLPATQTKAFDKIASIAEMANDLGYLSDSRWNGL